MQRFTREMQRVSREECKSGEFKRLRTFMRCMDKKTGKFVYGANGTLTQAARWRGGVMARLCGDAECGKRGLAYSFEPREHLKVVRQFLEISRKGGCKLPS